MFVIFNLLIVLLPVVVTAILIILWAATKKQIYVKLTILLWLFIVLMMVLSDFM